MNHVNIAGESRCSEKAVLGNPKIFTESFDDTSNNIA